MKRLFKSTLALVLILTLITCISSVMAVDIEKQHYDYGSYVLLGDSIASGWSDVKDKGDTSFNYIPESYGAYIAEDLGLSYYNGTYHPMAGIAFRTVEMRYMLEDDFEGDRFLFYSVNRERIESRIPDLRKAISEAGLITLNVGGNDWGSYLGWTLFELMDETVEENEEFFKLAEEYLVEAGTATDTIDTLIDAASVAGCLDQLFTVLPKALDESFTNFVKNWDIMIEDIYALNPDVTLVVVGMFDNALQDESMTNGEVEPEEGFDIQHLATKIQIGQYIIDIANLPMKQGVDKYGYIYVEPIGTLCEKQHPSAAGHRHIADMILDALPYANFPYTDVDYTSENYTAIEYMWKNNIIDGATETEFAPDEAITKGAVENAFAKLAGTEAISSDETKAMRMHVISALLNMDSEASFMKKLKILGLAIECFMNNFQFNFLSEITKAETAKIIYDYINL